MNVVFLGYQMILMLQILTALGLHALQHRGQDSTGIVTSDKIIFMLTGVWDRFLKFFQTLHF